MKKILLTIAIALCLEACVPAAFVAGAAGATVGGLVIYDQRSTKTMLDDQDIAYRAQARLSQNPELKDTSRLSVMTFNHAVLIVGQAPSSYLKNLAENLVRSVPKVNRVYNEITVEKPASAIAGTNDTWLTTKVKSALLAEKGLNSAQIKILTENGVVYMMGLVTRNQADLATDCVQKVAGVQKIVKLFEYLN